MKYIFIAIAIIIVLAFFASQEKFYSGQKEQQKISYEKATVVVYANILKNHGIQPSREKLLDLVTEHIYIHNAVEDLMFKENDAQELYDNIMGEYAEWEENYGSRSLAPGN